MNVEVPLNTKGMTLEQYQKYYLVADDEDKEFVGHKLLNIFLGVDMRDVRSIPQKEADALIKDIYDALDDVPPMEYTFTHKGIEFGFIPDFEAITLGEYIDLEDFLTKPNEWHKAAAVLFRPIKNKSGKLYNIQPYSGDRESQDFMKSLPASQFIGATVFFYRLSKHLLAHSATYLEQISKKLRESSKTSVLRDSSQSGGVGSPLYTRLRKEMQRSLEKLLK